MSSATKDAVVAARRAGAAPRRAEGARRRRRPSGCAEDRPEELADVAFGPVESPFGTLHAALTRSAGRCDWPPGGAQAAMLEELGLRALAADHRGAPARLDPLRSRARGVLRRAPAPLSQIGSGPAADGTLCLGASCGRTAAIPYGGHSSYSEIAAEAGSPRAAPARSGNAPAPTRSRS